MNPDYPEASAEDMSLLAGLLSDRSVEVRVAADGELQFRDRLGALNGPDRLVVKHYAGPLADWLTDRGSVPTDDRGLTPVRLNPFACGACGQSDPDRQAYRLGDDGGLLVVCVDCGKCWPWGCPGEPLTQQQRAFSPANRRRRRSA